MSKKHNTKHRRGQSSYPDKVREMGSVKMADPVLTDGKRASAKR